MTEGHADHIHDTSPKENTMPMPKLVILRYDERITVCSGSALPGDVADIVECARSSHRPGVGGTVPVVVVHGALEVGRFEVRPDDADHLVGMLHDADRRAHAEWRR